jgi:hypothetical protein
LKLELQTDPLPEKKTTEVFLGDSVVKGSRMFAMTIKFDNFFPGVENSGDA